MNTFNAKCPGCGHIWIVAYLPMDLLKVAERAEDAMCPKGCDDQPVCAPGGAADANAGAAGKGGA